MARITSRTAAAVVAIVLALALPTMALALPVPQLKVTAPLAVRAGAGFDVRGVAANGVVPGESVQVLLQHKSGAGWTTLSTTPAATSGASTFSARVVAPQRGHWRVLAETTATVDHEAALSTPSPVKAVGTKVIALTFDDGPWRGSTDSIVAILKREDAEATFFMLGSQVRGQAARAKSVIAAGNEVGVHSWNHAVMTKRSSSVNAKDLRRCKATLTAVTGRVPVWFRPPYGSTSSALRRTASGVGLRQVIWTVDTLDWKNRNTAIITSRALKGARSGGIILMHDGGGNRSATVRAVPGIIRTLRKRGYDFVTLSELAALGYKIR